MFMFVPSFDPRTLASFLDIGDRRTLDAILQKAGFGHNAAFSGHISVVCFLDNQEFIARENAGLKIIRNIHLAANIDKLEHSSPELLDRA